MNRRNFVKKGGSLALIAAAGATIPLTSGATELTAKPYLHHYVLFWLKPDLSEEKIAQFAGFFEELKKIKSVQSLSYGRAAKTEQRDVVDNSFTFALSITFATLDDQNAYQKDAIHLEAIKKFSDYWTKVVVHDAMMK